MHLPDPVLITGVDRSGRWIEKVAAREVQLTLLTELPAEFQVLPMEMITTPCSSRPICGIIELYEMARTR